jgi:protein-disulfide isomerase
MLQNFKYINKKWFFVALLFIMVFWVIFVVAFLKFLKTQDPDFVKQQKQESKALLKNDKGLLKGIYNHSFQNCPYYGSKDAPVTIIVFFDYQCDFCFQLFSFYRSLMNEYPKDKVVWIFKELPVSNKSSVNASLASHCAWQQEKYLPMHDKLFMTNNYSKESIKLLARQLGLNMGKFDNCFQSKKVKNILFENIRDAVNLKVKGTPVLFINQDRVNGLIEEKKIKDIIKQNF